MNAFILTLGTRGDLELFLALGSELQRRGHNVVIGASPFNEARTRAVGLPWQRVGDSTLSQLREVLRSLASIEDKAQRTGVFYRRWLGPELAAHSARIAELVEGCDLFISNLKLSVLRHGKRVPTVFVDYDPPVSLSDAGRFGVDSAAHRASTLDLVAMNRQLIDPREQWAAQFRFSGFWRALANTPWVPPGELSAFLRAGPPPVALTMGSMAMANLDATLAALDGALRSCGARAVIVGGWADVAGARMDPTHMYAVREIPYDWLFSRSSCVIHHGGTGTTTAVLLAGVPSIVVPQIACQQVMGGCLLQQHLATAVFDESALTPEGLAEAITLASTEGKYVDAAKCWQAVIKADNGSATAADLVEEHWARFQ